MKMKKSILVIAVLFMAFNLNAQKRKITPPQATSSRSGGMNFSKGDIVVSGLFGYTSNNTSSGKEGTFGFAPSGSYFIKNNISLGASIGFKNRSVTPTGGSSTSSNEFGIGVFGRYFFKPASQFSLFAQAGIDFASIDNGGGGSSTTRFGLAFKPGLNYFLNDHFSIETTIGEVGFTNTSGGGGSSNTDFNFGVNFTQLGFGLNYKF